MKLTAFTVREFRSILNSSPVKVGDITCLVGKNEAGKTGLLRALYRLNPVVAGDAVFSVTDDYPRSTVSDYEQGVAEGKHAPSDAVIGVFELSDEEVALIERDLGKGALRSRLLMLNAGYYTGNRVALELDESVVCDHLRASAKLPATVAEKLSEQKSIAALELATKAIGEDESATRLLTLIGAIKGEKGAGMQAYIKHLKARVPKFLYFDEFYQLTGHENIEKLKERVANGQLKASDHPLLGLVRLANLTLDNLLDIARTQDLKNRLEGAGNRLSRTILKYWSQNKHIHMRFDVRQAKPKDPEGMREGTNIWAEVFDSKHLATTGVGERSRGFVWFFSFLAWFSEWQGKKDPIILLLDEPGLTLHGSAQADLLRYMEEELGASHQVVYSTHSPFMVDSKRFDRVRIVQDLSMERDDLPPEEEGTKVFEDVLRASKGSLFPLHGALGFEIAQTLFIGPYTVVVEGVSDLLYIETMKGLLERRGRGTLDPRWVIAPVGGIDKVPAFVALFGAQQTLTVATLIDFQKKDAQTIENLYKQKLLEKKRVLTYAHFVKASEADVEDMLGDDFYLSLVQGEYAKDLTKALKPGDLPKGSPRVLARLEEYFQSNPLKVPAAFNHYRPARYFSEQVGALESSLPPEALDRFEAAFVQLNTLLT